MSSKRTRTRSIVHKYFVVEDDGSAECNICAKMLKITSGNTSSMRRHLESLHKDKFNEMLEKEIEINQYNEGVSYIWLIRILHRLSVFLSAVMYNVDCGVWGLWGTARGGLPIRQTRRPPRARPPAGSRLDQVDQVLDPGVHCPARSHYCVVWPGPCRGSSA